jgi:amino acid transporter
LNEKAENSKKREREEIEERRLSPIQGILYGVGCGIGASIFVLLSTAIDVAGPGVLISLTLGGFLIFLTALNYSELTTSLPYSGGAYNFSKEAMGGFLAFIIGFFLWLANIGTCVFSALAFSIVLQQMFPFIGIYTQFFPYISLIVILFIGVGAFRSERIATNSLIYLTVTLISLFIIFIIAGTLISPLANPAVFEPEYLSTGTSFFAVINIFAFLFISFTSITSNLAYLNPSLRNPSKNVPKVNIMAIFLTLVIYLSVTTVVLINLGQGLQDVRETPVLLAEVLEDILGPFGFYLMGFGVLISTIIAMNAAIGSAISVFHALARDNYVPEEFQKINKKTNVPTYSLIITTALSLIITYFITFIQNSLDLAANMTSFIYFFGLAFVNFAAVSLRYKRKELDRPFKAPLFPYLPIIVGVTCLILSFVLSPLAIVIGLAILVFALLYYLLTITDRYSIPMTIGGIKFGAILIAGISIWILKNLVTFTTSIPGFISIFDIVLSRILVFIIIFAACTLIFDIIPLREFIFYFVRKVDKEKVAISIGGGQIIELGKNKLKIIYHINLLLGLIQLISAIFVFIIVGLFFAGILSISQIVIASVVIEELTAEFIVNSVFIILGGVLFLGGATMIYYNQELESF